MGVFLAHQPTEKGLARLPHARGGVSFIPVLRPTAVTSSPRPWGCFLRELSYSDQVAVFPTPVGVFPDACQMPLLSASLPHARGGVSQRRASLPQTLTSSPRPWGCFLFYRNHPFDCLVFPTPVGVFLMIAVLQKWDSGLPHARGGVSPPSLIAHQPTESSPRPWGCFQQRIAQAKARLVFPTPVGVFPG